MKVGILAPVVVIAAILAPLAQAGEGAGARSYVEAAIDMIKQSSWKHPLASASDYAYKPSADCYKRIPSFLKGRTVTPLPGGGIYAHYHWDFAKLLGQLQAAEAGSSEQKCLSYIAAGAQREELEYLNALAGPSCEFTGDLRYFETNKKPQSCNRMVFGYLKDYTQRLYSISQAVSHFAARGGRAGVICNTPDDLPAESAINAWASAALALSQDLYEDRYHEDTALQCAGIDPARRRDFQSASSPWGRTFSCQKAGYKGMWEEVKGNFSPPVVELYKQIKSHPRKFVEAFGKIASPAYSAYLNNLEPKQEASLIDGIQALLREKADWYDCLNDEAQEELVCFLTGYVGMMGFEFWAQDKLNPALTELIESARPTYLEAYSATERIKTTEDRAAKLKAMEELANLKVESLIKPADLADRDLLAKDVPATLGFEIFLKTDDETRNAAFEALAKYVKTNGDHPALTGLNQEYEVILKDIIKTRRLPDGLRQKAYDELAARSSSLLHGPESLVDRYGMALIIDPPADIGPMGYHDGYLELITLEQLKRLPRGTVLRSIEGEGPALVVGRDKINTDEHSGYLRVGFLKSPEARLAEARELSTAPTHAEAIAERERRIQESRRIKIENFQMGNEAALRKHDPNIPFWKYAHTQNYWPTEHVYVHSFQGMTRPVGMATLVGHEAIVRFAPVGSPVFEIHGTITEEFGAGFRIKDQFGKVHDINVNGGHIEAAYVK